MNDVTAYVCYTDTVAGVGEASVDLLVIPGNIGHVHGQLNSSPELKFWSFESRVYFFWLMLIFSPQILLFCIWLFRCGYPLTILLVISYDSQILSLDSTCNNLYDNQIISMEKVSCVKCLLSLSKGKRMDLINLNMQVQVIEFHKDIWI